MNFKQLSFCLKTYLLARAPEQLPPSTATQAQKYSIALNMRTSQARSQGG